MKDAWPQTVNFGTTHPTWYIKASICKKRLEDSACMVQRLGSKKKVFKGREIGKEFVNITG